MKFITLTLFAMLCFVVSCASIPGNNVRLEKYPSDENAGSLDLNYGYEWPYPSPYRQDDKENSEFKQKIISKLEEKSSQIKESKSGKSAKCIVKIAARVRGGNFFTCPITNLISPLTLTIIPFYCQSIFEIHASLMSTKTNLTLATYDLKDKAHEIWSIFLLLGIADKYQRDNENWGSRVVENTLAEALVRQVIHDANQFQECKKR